MAKTTNILDLNNRLEKVEKENIAQNSYTSLKNKPKINNVTLTGNKSLADIGAAADADLTTLAGDVGDMTQLTTTDKSSVVAAINEVNRLTETYGVYIITDATDLADFFKKLINIADQTASVAKDNVPHNLVGLYENVDQFYGSFMRVGAHNYFFTLVRSFGSKQYNGYCDLVGNTLIVYEYTGTSMS